MLHAEGASFIGGGADDAAVAGATDDDDRLGLRRASALLPADQSGGHDVAARQRVDRGGDEVLVSAGHVHAHRLGAVHELTDGLSVL